MPDFIRLEVAFATPELQRVVSLEVPAGSTIAEAVEASGIRVSFPEHDISSLPKGIWGKKHGDDHPVSDGDRIEIYRPLVEDPREARRRRAREKR